MAADRYRLDRLLAPQSIAFVGGRRAVLAMEQCERLDFAGPMWLVNPTDGVLGGRAAHRSLSSLPDVPDAVFVAVGADTTIDVVAEAATLGVGGAVSYASGFAETGRTDRRATLREVAGDMPVIGPNCHGFVNAMTGAALWPDVNGCDRIDRGVAVISQSGDLAINLSMQQRAIPLAAVVSVGNQDIVTAADCIDALVRTGRINAIGLYVESVEDGRAFATAAIRAADAGVPLVALTAGSSERGGSLVATHTAAIAGPAAARRAFFNRYGVSLVDTPEELAAAMAVLSHGGRLPGPAVVALSSSGGEAALIADLADDLPLEFDPFDDRAATALAAALNGPVGITNPLDYHTYIWGDSDRMTSCFSTAMAGRDAALLVLDWPADGIDDADWYPTLDAFCAAAAATGVRCVMTSTLTETLPGRVAAQLAVHGIAAVPGIEHALAALVAAQPVTPDATLHHPPPMVANRSAVDEADAKDRLAAAGLEVPAGRRCSREQAATTANEIGFPVVVKALGPAHRTEVGGVAIGLGTVADVESAVAAMAHLGETFLVERHIDKVIAELLIGVAVEATLGWTLTLGAGGVLAELIDDTATVLLPCSTDALRSALGELRIGTVLAGYRGAAAGFDAAVAAVIAIGEFAVAEEYEIEVNPLLVRSDGVWLADVLLTELEVAV